MVLYSLMLIILWFVLVNFFFRVVCSFGLFRWMLCFRMIGFGFSRDVVLVLMCLVRVMFSFFGMWLWMLYVLK